MAVDILSLLKTINAQKSAAPQMPSMPQDTGGGMMPMADPAYWTRGNPYMPGSGGAAAGGKGGGGSVTAPGAGSGNMSLPPMAVPINGGGKGAALNPIPKTTASIGGKGGAG